MYIFRFIPLPVGPLDRPTGSYYRAWTIKVYVKSCDPDCKILHILVSFNGIAVLSVGFVSEHKALDFKPILDVKMKIWSDENEDEKFSIFQEIEFPL